MYGTIARLRLQPGMEQQLQDFSRATERVQIPGLVATYVYRMDADPRDYYLVVIFDSQATYIANATSAEQHTRYEQLRALLERDPEWHDGAVVYAPPAR